MIQNDGARNIKMYLCKDKRPTSWNIRRGLIYFFLLILWKFGFIGWLEVMPWSTEWTGPNGTSGFLFNAHVSTGMLLDVTGEDVFLLSCFGTSSLSRILEVFSSSCLDVCGADRTSRSSFGFELQEGEQILGSSDTISCSHSSAISSLVLSPTSLSKSEMFPSIISSSVVCTDGETSAVESW